MIGDTRSYGVGGHGNGSGGAAITNSPPSGISPTVAAASAFAARLPGVRHHLHSSIVLALDRAGRDRRADRHDQTVIGERRTAAKLQSLGRRIERRRES